MLITIHPCIHIALSSREADCFLHPIPGDEVMCLTPRGHGICTCGLFRLCDPARLCCADDCSCHCHPRKSESFGEGVLNSFFDL